MSADKTEAVLKAAQALVDAVQSDGIDQGGLLSRATIAASDRTRAALGAFKAERERVYAGDKNPEGRV